MARTHRAADKGYASPGAVNQHGGDLPVYVCNTCQRDVAWAESRRTGRKYLVNVSRGYLDQRFYRGNDTHDCDYFLNQDRASAEAHAEHQAQLDASMGWLRDVQALRKAGQLDAARELATQGPPKLGHHSPAATQATYQAGA